MVPSFFWGGLCIHHRPGKFFFAARKAPQKIFFSVVVVCVFFRRPTMEPFSVKNYRDFEASFLEILVFRGTIRTD